MDPSTLPVARSEINAARAQPGRVVTGCPTPVPWRVTLPVLPVGHHSMRTGMSAFLATLPVAEINSNLRTARPGAASSGTRTESW